jgi:hypothetical protein
MSLTIQQRPNQVAGVTKSDWVAARNPVLYKVRREDSIYNSIISGGGNEKIQITGINLTSYFIVGDSVVFYKTILGIYVSATITACAFVAGNTLITLNTLYTAGDSGFITNLSKRTDWKIYIDVYDGVTLQQMGVRMGFSASPIDCIAIVDLSAILRQYLTADWQLPAGVNEAAAGSSVKFYIQYQEYYDGANQGAYTSDGANLFYTINAAMQVYYNETAYGHGGNMLSFIPSDTGRNWLSRKRVNSIKQKIRMLRGWPFTMSFIWPSSITAMARRIIEYDAGNNILATTYTNLVATLNKVNRLTIPALNALTKKFDITIGSLVNSGASGGPVAGTNSFNVLLGSVFPIGSYFVTGGGSFSFTAPPAGSPCTVQIGLYNTSTLQYQLLGSGGASLFGGGFTFAPALVAATIPFDAIQVAFLSPSGSTYTYNYFGSIFTQCLATTVVDIEEPDYMQNIIWLNWQNSVGGDEWHPFNYSQDQNFALSGGSKAKHLTLLADNLDYVEWEAINELNSTDEVYKENIVELSSSVLKTSTRLNQQVYIVDQFGNKMGVVVIPKAAKTESKRSKHFIEIEIELPEVQ